MRVQCGLEISTPLREFAQGLAWTDRVGHDRRRRIVAIAPDQHDVIADWLAPGAAAWRRVLTPLAPAQRRLFVDTLRAYDAAVAEEREN
jgi:DNA-binding MarR family transcriptional regulator